MIKKIGRISDLNDYEKYHQLRMAVVGYYLSHIAKSGHCGCYKGNVYSAVRSGLKDNRKWCNNEIQRWLYLGSENI